MEIKVNKLMDHKIVIVIPYLFEEIMLLKRILMVLTILLLTILLTNLMALLLLGFLAGPNYFVHPHCLNSQSRVQDLLLTNSI